MKKYFIILFISFFFLSCIGAKLSVSTERTLVFQNLQSGMEWFEGMVLTKEEPFELSVVRLDINQYSIEIAAENPIESGFHTVLEYQKLSKSYVALSGGFMKSFYPPLPLGLVKSNGKILNRPHNTLFFSGLFCSQRGGLTIVPYMGKDATISWDHCLQSGPLLVYGERSALDEAKNYPEDFFYKPTNRAFLAVDQQGRVLLAVTGKTTIPALVDLLQRPTEQGGLECWAALNLSGVDVGIVVDVAGKHLTAGDIEFYPPNVIIVK